ncbi:MAG: LamG-like jellyroll fold domain-containing protein [Bacteroidota bacterium]
MRKHLLGLILLFFVGAAGAQNSLNFSRIDSTNVTINNGPILGQNFTIEAFIQPISLTSAGYIFGNDSVDASATASKYRRAPYISVSNAHVITYGFDTLVAAVPTHLSKKVYNLLHSNHWNHIALTYNNTALKLYLNGSFIDSLVVKTTVAPIRIKYIGGQKLVTKSTTGGVTTTKITSEYFNGNIDEIRVWDVCKSAAELTASASPNAITAPLTTPNLKMLYDFNGDAIDETGNSTATITGSTNSTESYTATSFPALSWTGTKTDGTLTFSVTTKRTAQNLNTNPKYDSCSVFAAYITDMNDKPIKTLVHYGANHAYELFFYEKDFGGMAPDVISGASQYSKAVNNWTITYNLTWDGKDMFGNLVNDGQYKLKLDLNDHTEHLLATTSNGVTTPAFNGVGCNWDTVFVKGMAADVHGTVSDTSLLNISMAWNPTNQTHSMNFSRIDSTNVSINNGPILGQNFTVEAFVMPNSLTSAGYIFGNDSVDGSATASKYRRAPYIAISNAHVITYGFDTLAATVPTHLSKKVYNLLHSNHWNHLALTYNNASLKLYLNGSFIDSLVVKATVAPISIKYIGGQKLATKSTTGGVTTTKITSEYFNGNIDEIRVWDVCKTAAELAAKATPNAITTPLTTANLQMLYDFEGEAVDRTGKTTATTTGTTYNTGSYTPTTYPALSWTGTKTAGNLTVAVTTKRTAQNLNTNPKYDSCSVFAAYITDMNDKPIKTIVHYGANHAYELFFYEKDFGGLAPDVISGASQYSKAVNNWTITYNLTWDGKDMFGNLVNDGQYKIKLDLNDHTEHLIATTSNGVTTPAFNGVGCNWDTVFVKGTAADVHGLVSDTSLINIVTAWNPEGTVGVHAPTSNNGVNVYPNPSNGNFNISLGEAVSGDVTIKIFNTFGQLISEKKITKTENVSVVNYDITNFNNGLYYIDVVGNGKSIQSKMLITK